MKQTSEVESRFWSKVDIRGDDECWLWQGGLDRDGYGLFQEATRRTVRAHRKACEVAHGPLGKLQALHSCDNPPCCNPKHLFGGTNADNMRDRNAKGRQASGDRNGSRTKPERLRRGDNHPYKLRPEIIIRGEKHHKTKLSDEQVRQIRSLYADGVIQKELAKRFGVVQPHISRIIRGENR